MTEVPQQAREGQPQGLTSAQAAQRMAAGQGNRLPPAPGSGTWPIVRRNLFTLFNLLNCVLAALLVAVGSYRNLLFMGVVVSNALIGLTQELRAKYTHDRLLLLSEAKVRTLRDGRETLLPPAALVLGDAVRLKRGDQVPADATMLTGAAEVNEALLTGESEPMGKQPGDRLLSGSFVTEGDITACLTAVGAESFAGKLQQSARRVRRADSALMASLKRIIRAVSIAIVPLGVALYLRQSGALGLPLPTAVTKTVAATLGMIPEGLMLLTSVALAVGVVRLGKRNALVNELYGIENLARVDVLCLDKTGTLTSGRMRVADVLPLQGESRESVGKMLAAFNAVFAGEEGPTSTALRDAFAPSTDVAAQNVVPFSSERKWSAATLPVLGTLLLGAPERLLAAHAEPLALAGSYAAKGLRVLALVRAQHPVQSKTLPEAVTPLALVTLGDTLRPDAQDTLRYFAQQGVQVKVISGDSALTVSRIAAEAGLAGAERAADCTSLGDHPDYDTLARTCTVFGRVSPDDKRRLVQALKKQGHSVGMIGDGVNDVPALKAADCSIAMAGGSDAAARVAQITLLDADFAVMPGIVLEGRRVINNITRASSLFLVKNIFSFLLAGLLLALPYAYPFAPIQLTLVSMFTIGIPSFVLALQPNRERVRGSFLKNVLARALPGGLTVTAACATAMAVGGTLGLSDAMVSTVCTMIAAFCGLCVLALACLPMDVIRAGLTALMTAGVVLTVALFPELFYLTTLSGQALTLLLACGGGAALALGVVEGVLRGLRKRAQTKEPLPAPGR